MNTVKQSAKTTGTFLVFFLAFWIFRQWWTFCDYDFVQDIRWKLASKAGLPPFFRAVLDISFGSFLLVGVEYAVLKNLYGLKALQAFVIPLTVSVLAALAAEIPVMNYYWFWAGYGILVLIGVRRSFHKLAPFQCGADRMLAFVRELGKTTGASGSRLDFCAVYLTKSLLSALFAVMGILVVMFLVTNRGSFGIY